MDTRTVKHFLEYRSLVVRQERSSLIFFQNHGNRENRERNMTTVVTAKSSNKNHQSSFLHAICIVNVSQHDIASLFISLAIALQTTRNMAEEEGERTGNALLAPAGNADDQDNSIDSDPSDAGPARSSIAPFQYDSPHGNDDFARSVAKHWFQKTNKKPVTYFTMSIGNEKYQTILESPPFASTKKKEFTTDFKPTRKSLVNEIARRAHFLIKENESSVGPGHPFFSCEKRLRKPRPAQWTIPRMIHWLQTNVLSLNDKDVEFLDEKINSYKNKLTRALQKQERAAERAAAQDKPRRQAKHGGRVPGARPPVDTIVIDHSLRDDNVRLDDDADAHDPINSRLLEKVTRQFTSLVKAISGLCQTVQANSRMNLSHYHERDLYFSKGDIMSERKMHVDELHWMLQAKSTQQIRCAEYEEKLITAQDDGKNPRLQEFYKRMKKSIEDEIDGLEEKIVLKRRLIEDIEKRTDAKQAEIDEFEAQQDLNATGRTGSSRRRRVAAQEERRRSVRRRLNSTDNAQEGS